MNLGQIKLPADSIDEKALRGIAEHILTATRNLINSIGDDGLFSEEGNDIFTLMHRQLSYSKEDLQRASALGNEVLDLFEKKEVPIGIGFFTLWILMKNTWKVYRKHVLAKCEGVEANKMIQETLDNMKDKTNGHA